MESLRPRRTLLAIADAVSAEELAAFRAHLADWLVIACRPSDAPAALRAFVVDAALVIGEAQVPAPAARELRRRSSRPCWVHHAATIGLAVAHFASTSPP